MLRSDIMVQEKKHKTSKPKEKERKPQEKSSSSSSSEQQLFNDEAETDDEVAINLDEELHPIGYYISDRKAVLDQVFSVTTEKKIRAMLPPVLKPLPLSELKPLCLDQLLGMSSKRILSILDGQQLESSSDTDDAVSESDDDPNTKVPEEKKQDAGCGDIDGFEFSGPDMDTLEIGITSKEIGDLFTEVADVKVVKKKDKCMEKKCKHAVKKKHKKHCDKEKQEEQQEKEESEGNMGEAKEGQKESAEEEKGKSLLEILELEMRARAIRALLREHEDSPARLSNLEQVSVKQEPPESDAPSHCKHVTTERTDAHVSRKARHWHNPFEFRVKREAVDGDSDASIETKRLVKDIHSDLETVSSGEEVFLDIEKKAHTSREDGEVSSLEEHRAFEVGEDDDIVEVKYNVRKDVIVVEESDCEGDMVARHLSLDGTESWAQRWLHSRGVQKVVTDSRMLARLHKRMKTVHKQQVCMQRARTTTPPIQLVGSVQEYRSLHLK